ncbi:MAG TPA: hypothetical protein PLD57_18030 [Aggregatilineales bacterium]|nr:hypothetical protein [Aggregatilineales bacterium]
MARPEAIDREELISAIWAAQGKVTVAAQRLGCTVRTIYNYANKYATVQNAIDEARAMWDEKLVDLAELKLFQEVNDGSAWAIKYALSTKGKSRGYVERQEHTGADGGALNVVVRWPEQDADADA